MTYFANRQITINATVLGKDFAKSHTWITCCEGFSVTTPNVYASTQLIEFYICLCFPTLECCNGLLESLAIKCQSICCVQVDSNIVTFVIFEGQFVVEVILN